jgi:3-dehydrotetronate 4-kinase
MLLGVIADDFTGASDVANTLARGGMNTVQFIGVPGTAAPADCEAGVVALKTRSIAAGDAVGQSLAALDWLRAQGCRQYLFKYCSTFDSTPAGNIGPVAAALLDALGAPAAVVCPAFPTTGRTVYMGHLFVRDRLLSQSGMEKHPLNPMTDPDLRRWLGRQTEVPVGFVPWPVIREGPGSIRAALDREAEGGRRLVVADAIVDDDLMALGAALGGALLITGGSGIALGLPANFAAKGLLGGTAVGLPSISGPGCVLSGSCSVASRAQVAAYAGGHPGLHVAPGDLVEGAVTARAALDFVKRQLSATPIVYSTDAPEKVAAAQSRYGREAVAAAIERFFADVAVGLMQSGVRRLVVGGGETSGAVIGAVGFDRLRIGREIDPGVPVLVADRQPPIGLALKSGNFGATDFFEKALKAMEAP